MKQVIECVPNFSEGRDLEIIRQITTAIESVEGISLLNVDPGASTNRTVVTCAGSPEAAVEGAFRGVQKAAELIDMRKHSGAHPRMGATDVCPFIPVSNVTWEEGIECAKKLGMRVGEELKIPVYLYETAAKDPARSNLSIIRAGEYEGFFEKIKQPAWKPDFGPAIFNEKSGATVIGAREFLVAYNANLNTKSVRRANSVAFDVRENGRIKTEDGMPSGKPVLDAKGEPVREPGMLKHVKAIGWYVEEYGIAQVSMNLTNLEETPLHAAFDACVESASKRGLRVTGSEVVGMLPKKCLIDAGRHYLRKQKWSEGASEEELIDVAIRSMGLSELKPFDPKEKIIELKMESANKYAAEIPLRVMETASKGHALLAEMAEKGNPASISDVGVGLLAVHACIEGAAMNVRINLAGLKDQALSASLREKMQHLVNESESEFKRLHAVVEGKLG